MPTGYTADVADGTITDLKPFVMRLARGMGALVTMRDDAWDAPVPESFKPSTYNADKLAEAKSDRDSLMAMTDAECGAAAKAEAQKYDADLLKAREEHTERRNRYTAMLAKVVSWKGAPEGIKDFALQQLRDGRDFDCREPFKFWSERPPEDGRQWRSNQLEEVERNIAYHTKGQAEEEARTAGRNAWLSQLRASLDDTD